MEIAVTEDSVIEEIELMFREQIRLWREEDGLSEVDIKELIEEFFETVCNQFDDRIS